MKSERKYPYGRQSITSADICEVVKTLKSDWLTQGPKIGEFEGMLCAYTGAKYAVAVSNGTAALHIASLALGLKPDDEVITSPITFLASANCTIYSGARPRFADIDEATACIAPDEIRKKTTGRTKAIIPVHFAGQSCDMAEIDRIAKKHDLYVIEDAAHAIGSEYRGGKVGSCRYSDMTVFSFHPVKTITTGEGGAITTNNKQLRDTLLQLRSHGITRDKRLLTRNDGPWYYEMQMLGFNYRLTDIQAALGISQMKRLGEFVSRRRELVVLYRGEFSQDERFSFLEEKPYSTASFHLCPLLIDFSKVCASKKEIFEQLVKRGLNLQVHYIPVHLQPFYTNLGFREGDFPKAEEYYRKTISLPLYYGLKNSDVKSIVRIIKEEVR